MVRSLQKLSSALAFTAILAGCAVNPVTGKQELALISEDSEIRMGQENYAPAQQSQGGQYTVDPSVTNYIAGVGGKLAAVSDRPQLPYEFVVLNNSVPNAWAMPGGKIAVNRGLLVELDNEAELAAVLGHEIVHAAARHGAKGVERGMLLQAGTIGIGVALSDNQNAGLLVGAAAVGATMINQKYSREQELESDYYGMRYMAKAGYDPKAAVTLQEKFVKLAGGRNPSWLEGLFSSHPPSPERVEANRTNLATLPQGGVLAAETYRQHMSTLLRDQKAYAEYDKGQDALAEKNHKIALQMADEAIAAEPREPLFHILKGEALLTQDKAQQAISSFDQAIVLNPGYFEPYLKRGLARQQLGNTTGAKSDFETSNQLMPNSTANYNLGKLALADNQPAKAMEYFKVAASSQSVTGQKAAKELAALELAQHPEKYIRISLALEPDGRVSIRAENLSPVTVQDIVVEVGIRTPQGKMTEKETVVIRGPLAPGANQSAATRLQQHAPVAGQQPTVAYDILSVTPVSE